MTEWLTNSDDDDDDDDGDDDDGHIILMMMMTIATSSDRVVDQLNLGFSSSQNTFGGKSQQTLFYFESIFGVILPSEGNPYQHGAFCLELMMMIEPLRLLMFKYDDCHDNV